MSISIVSSLSSDDPFENASVANTFVCSNPSSVFLPKVFKEVIWVAGTICDCRNCIDRLISIPAIVNYCSNYCRRNVGIGVVHSC